MERSGAVTFKGNPMTLLGPELNVGDPAPPFQVVNGALEPFTLEDLKGQATLISVVPSLDTPVCETQTKHFNEEAAGLGLRVLTISVDLPFAQKRFCTAHNVEGVQCLSDYQARSFGEAWGLLIKELALLARSVFIVDADGTIAYKELVKEIAEQPDYDAALAAAGKLA